MEVKAALRNYRISARKARLLADQVRITCFEPELSNRSILRCRLGSTKGPFLSDRAIYFFPRRLTMY